MEEGCPSIVVVAQVGGGGVDSRGGAQCWDRHRGQVHMFKTRRKVLSVPHNGV